MQGRSPISTDRITALILIVAFAAYGWQGHALQSSLGVDVVGPGFYPSAIAILGMTMGGLLLISRESSPKGSRDAVGYLRALVPLGLMLAYVLSLEYLGFPIATLAFLVLTVRYLGAPTWFGAVVFGVLATAAAIVIFRYGLEVRLPQGVFIRLW